MLFLKLNKWKEQNPMFEFDLILFIFELILRKTLNLIWKYIG